VDIVNELRRRGRTLLLASHRRDEIDCLTDRVLALDCGRLVSAPAAQPPSNVVPLRMRR
jgi:ABC-type multidrug transport system ATPase subunit